MRRTKEEIAAEVATLRAMQPNVRHHGMSGDNRAAIDAQIAVLEGGWTENRIYDEFGDESAEEFEQNLLDEALNARQWMVGDETEPPSEGWKPLVS